MIHVWTRPVVVQRVHQPDLRLTCVRIASVSLQTRVDGAFKKRVGVPRGLGYEPALRLLPTPVVGIIAHRLLLGREFSSVSWVRLQTYKSYTHDIQIRNNNFWITQTVAPCGYLTRYTLHDSHLPSHRANNAVKFEKQKIYNVLCCLKSTELSVCLVNGCKRKLVFTHSHQLVLLHVLQEQTTPIVVLVYVSLLL
ncbi:hypothetical protein SFRURICE_000984 [Spodoptera frugiperda]|nr:hypothetical protein SFRURICE_000984 [Spodoptera frugiperda]